jgi:hypothetical protein
VLDGVAMFPSEPSLGEAAEAIVATTYVELGEVVAGAVEEEFTARNITSCEGYAAYDTIDKGIWLVPPSAGTAFNPMRPPPFQVEVTAPAEATMAHLTFELGGPFTGSVVEGLVYDANALLNAGEPVEFTYDVSPGGIVGVSAEPTAVYYDLAPDGVHGSLDFAVEGDEVYYLAFFNLQLDTIVLDTIEVEFDVEPTSGTTGGETGGSGGDTMADSTGGEPMPPVGTTGVEDTETDADPGATLTDDGCACRSAPGRSAPGLAFLPLLWALRRRRR